MAKMFGFLLIPILISYTSGKCTKANQNEIVYNCVGDQITDLNNIPSDDLENIQSLTITKIDIFTIKSDTLSRFDKSLLSLKLSYCNISEIEAKSFDKLVNLKILNLGNNRLTTVKSSWLNSLRHLEKLDLSHNQIADIDDEVLGNLRSIKEINLSDNKFKCLNKESLSKMTKLEKVVMKKNRDFKCPNAMKEYFANQNIIFEYDLTWRDLLIDLVEPKRDDNNEWISKKQFTQDSADLLTSSASVNYSSKISVLREFFLLSAIFMVTKILFVGSL